jgi:hypothetical protein
VEKKGRKIILSKDEYSIDYDIRNRRELILPPEFYLNITKLEKYYFENYDQAKADWDITPLRMYLTRRYDIKSDLIHLTNISKFCKVPMVDLVRKRYKPYQNKLLMKVKKRIKLKHARRRVSIVKPRKAAGGGSVVPIGLKAKVQSHALKPLGIPSATVEEDPKSPINDEDNVSNISDHEKASRMSILDLIILISKKVKNLSTSFDKFSKKNSQGKGFMNIFLFNSFLGVELGLKLTSANKRGMFTVLDWNEDGYATVKEFIKVFSNNEEDIKKAMEDPHGYKDGMILDFVIEQIYHDIVFFNKNAVEQLEEKLDSRGRMAADRLEKYLTFYKAVSYTHLDAADDS